MKLEVAVVGVGKVGRGLHAALRKARIRCTLVGARAVSRPLSGNVVVLAARDGALPALAKKLADQQLVPKSAVVVHCAGALDAEVLAPLRGVSAGVAQMHPMISFADPGKPPSLEGGHAHVAGDPEAVKRARAMCKAIGLIPRTFESLDRIAYHAAAGLVANGAAALAAAGTELLTKAGVPRETAPLMLGPLLRSVAENVHTLGLPHALTGPVRRGDAAGVKKHLETLRAKAPSLVPLYVACAQAQLPLARALGDAPSEAFDEVAALLPSE